MIFNSQVSAQILNCSPTSHITKSGKWWCWKGCVCLRERVCVCIRMFVFLTRIERISIGLKLASFIILVHDYIQRTWNLSVQNKR